MNRMKYRACILIVLIVAIFFGVWFWANRDEKDQEPFAGATFVHARGQERI